MHDVRLIDANALLHECEKAYEFEDRRGQLAHCISAIKAAPTIDAQPVKHGKWERTDMFVKCSECGVELLDEAFFGIRVFDNGYMPFCPCCCAKMNGVDAE